MYWKFLVIRLIKSKTFSILVSVFIIKCLVSCTMEVFRPPFLFRNTDGGSAGPGEILFGKIILQKNK